MIPSIFGDCASCTAAGGGPHTVTAELNASISSAWEPSSAGGSEFAQVQTTQTPKVITIVDGTGVPRPRPNVKFLLSRSSVQSYEQFARDVAAALRSKGGSTSPVPAQTAVDGQPLPGAVRLFTVRGREVMTKSVILRAACAVTNVQKNHSSADDSVSNYCLELPYYVGCAILLFH